MGGEYEVEPWLDDAGERNAIQQGATTCYGEAKGVPMPN
jgi:hypothetical protein